MPGCCRKRDKSSFQAQIFFPGSLIPGGRIRTFIPAKGLPALIR
jgi:hypothetical protein